MPSRFKVAEIWDEVVARFLRDGTDYLNELPEPFNHWFQAYAGTGDGEVERNAFPEPYIGDLAAGKVRAVMLGLNPGRAYLNLQAHDGAFAAEIKQLGSYHAWAATHPYFGETARQALGGTPFFFTARRRFLRDWFDHLQFLADEMLMFELYPWHSTNLNSQIRPCPDTLHQFIWEPIGECGNPIVFAFGAPWMRLVESMGFTIKARFCGPEYGSHVRSRCVLVACSPEGSTVIVEKHRGAAGPPSQRETILLRDYVRKIGLC